MTEHVGVALEDRNNEIAPPVDDEDTKDFAEDDDEEEDHMTTRSGPVSPPFDFANTFPDLYQTNHLIQSSPEGKQSRLYYHDGNQQRKLSSGTFISDSFYSIDIGVENKRHDYDTNIKSLDEDEYQLYLETL